MEIDKEKQEKIKFAFENVSVPKYQLGQNVDNVGVIINIQIGADFQMKIRRPLPLWDKTDEWWKEKPVYSILLNEPERQCSFETYKEHCPYDSYQNYETNIKEVMSVSMTEKELELREQAMWESI